MGCGSSTPALPMDPMETVRHVLTGKVPADMLDSVLDRSNVNTLLEGGVLGGGVTPLILAANVGNAEALKIILGMHPDLSATDDAGNTALHLAVKKGSEEAVDELIKAGSDVSLGNSEGIPPLHSAIVCNEKPEVLELLLNAGARTDFTTPELPLLTAVTGKNLAAVEVLLEHNVAHKDVMVPLPDGTTADMLSWATLYGNSRIVSLLALSGEKRLGKCQIPPLPDLPKTKQEEDEESAAGHAHLHDEVQEAVEEEAEGENNTVVGDVDLLKEGEEAQEGSNDETEEKVEVEEGDKVNNEQEEREGGDGEEEAPVVTSEVEEPPSEA